MRKSNQNEDNKLMLSVINALVNINLENNN
jgi:hypothetical protein